MHPLEVILILVLLTLSPTFSTNCIQQEDNSESNFCFCDSLDSSNGWLYTCLGLDSEILFMVKYVEDQSLTFQCGDEVPKYQSILQHLHLGRIRTFSFKSCPQPNASYSEILVHISNAPINQLKIESKQDNGPFHPNTFNFLSMKLESLILSGNRLTELSDSLFSNFTSLKYLSLSDNQLKSFPEDIFTDLTSLVVLEAANNVLESINGNLFHSLNSLEKLYLYKNRLKELPNDLFIGLKNLKVLDLANNQLTSIPHDAFKPLSNVIHIRLRGNLLESLPSDLFSHTLNLKNIDFNYNRFKEPLPHKLFHSLVHVENISLHDCNLTSIEPTFFQNCLNMTNVDLSRNNLTEVPENLFENNVKLKQVDLNFNLISELPSKLFNNHKYLEKLSFYKNNITRIPSEIFKQNKNVKTLIMSYNTLQNISNEVFQNLPNLETLDLSFNGLVFFSLALNENIKQIDLSNNRLTKMPAINWLQHLKLEKINLENNNISFFSVPLLYSGSKLSPVINLARNNISTVSVENIMLNDDIISELKLKDYENYLETRIILDSNPFNCDCRLHRFYSYAKKSYKQSRRSVRFEGDQSWTCKHPPRLSARKVMQIKSEEFVCAISDQCSPSCDCCLRAEDNKTLVNCSNHELNSVPDVIPKETNVLNLGRNSITNMEEFSNEKWNNLTELYLDDNMIDTLDTRNLPPALKTLSLKGNMIQYIDPSVLSYLSTSRMSVSLSRNPWMCNCSTIGFKKWLAEHYHMVDDVKDIICINEQNLNNSLSNSSILTISDDIMCPILEWPYKLHLISVTSICIVLAILLFVVSVLYYRNKQTVIAYVYIHMHNVFMCFFSEDDMDEHKIFDAFVSYSNSDRNVALALLDGLEPGFRLCIHERNWIAGNPISWNIINSVQNSKRTILVVSKEFLHSMWFQVEFRTAYYQMLEDKISRLIIIVKGDLPPKETLDKDLQYLMSTKTYLTWNEKWFWEKLKYALPHKKQILQNDVLALKERPASAKIKPVENQIAVLSSNDNKAVELASQELQSFDNLGFTRL